MGDVGLRALSQKEEQVFESRFSMIWEGVKAFDIKPE
jgi:hypothetical protein